MNSRTFKLHIHSGSKNAPPHITVVSTKCWPISITFDTRSTELVCNKTVIDLPTSPTYCCYPTLGNINCHIEQDTMHVRWSSWPSAWNSEINSSPGRLVSRYCPDLSPWLLNVGHDAGWCVYQTTVRVVTDLRQSLIDTWNSLSQNRLLSRTYYFPDRFFRATQFSF